MKNAFKILVLLSAVCAVVTFSGCNVLFPFNPTGNWVLTDDILYCDDNMIEHTGSEELSQRKMIYVFEKNGTGYIEVSGTKVYKFDYVCTEDSVTLTIDNKPLNMAANVNPENTTTEVKYVLDSDNDLVGAKLKRTDESDIADENGHTHHYKEEIILEKTL